MSHYSRNHKSVDLVYCGVPLQVIGVTFYPACPATEIDPPEPPFCEWDQVLIGGVDVTDLFEGDRREELDDAIVGELEGAYS